MLSDTAIRDILIERIDRQRRAHAIVVGVVSPGRRRIIAHGVRGAADPTPVDGRTLFEIGSATKMITALLLTEAVRRGELSLDQPVTTCLPASVAISNRNGRSITFRNLATHTSALPTFPPGSPAFGSPDWANYSAQKLYDSLADYRFTRDIGETWEYSNTGYGLLGLALARCAWTDYETLARSRVLEPLGMTSTAIVLTSELEALTAAPHGADRSPTSRIALPGLEAAGAFWSNVEDMLNFVSAALGLTDTSLAPAFSALLETPRIANPMGGEQALGWWVWGKGEQALLNHDGGSLGFTASIFCDPARRTGVVVLCNTMSMVHDLARHLLRPDYPLTAAGPAFETISLDSGQLNRYLGDYDAGGGALMVITRDDRSIMLQGPNAPKLPLEAKSNSEFVARAIGLLVTFRFGADGRACDLVIDYSGRSTPAVRVGPVSP